MAKATDAVRATLAIALIAIVALAATTMPRDESSATTATKRALVEKKYPQYAEFENQESFAGKTVLTSKANGNYCFAYATLGSGRPIAQATCFCVTPDGRVEETGEFPNSLDSHMGYANIDPKDCKGIR